MTADTRPAPDSAAAAEPSAQLLVDFMAGLTDCDEPAAVALALRAATEALGAEFTLLIRDGAVAAGHGARPSAVPPAALVDAARRGLTHGSLPGYGPVDLISAAVGGQRSDQLLAGRPRHAAFTANQRALLDGVARTLELHLRMLRAADDERGLRRQSEHEMRERKRAERALAHHALHDRLTGLANRSLVRERASHALDRARHGSGYVAALFVDLDHFKLANDSLDHQHGDKLLVLVAQRLAAILTLEENGRHNCTLARPGGDEFIVVCEDLESEHDAVTIAQQIRDAIQAPFFVHGQPVALTASVGIACAGGTENRPVEADALLRDADVALSRAKERGRDRYEIFDEQMRIRLLDRVELEGDLRAGLERDELRLLYQPVVTVSDGSLAAVEALVRWQHPTRGLLGPGEFIAVAEESDLIVSVGSWVIEEACGQIRRWHDSHPAELGVRVSVNVSARQLSPALIDTVAAALRRQRVDPSLLALEITETLLIEHTESAREVLAGLQELGVAIVLDDFGTGYSSLGYLNQFPLGQLKLDRSFIAELAHEPRSAKIVAATIDMARALGMTVVAEGVEDSDQLEVLSRLGCDYGQGFLFARPEPAAAAFERILAAYEHDREIASTRAVSGRMAALARPGAAPAEDPHRRQQVAIGRLAGWLFLVGSVVALPSDLLMGAPGIDATIALTLMGLLTGLICLALPWHRMSEAWLSVAAAVATLEITISVVAIGRHGAVLAPIYLLIATAAAYAFRDRRLIVFHVALASGAMTVPTWRADTSSRSVALTVVSILVLITISAVIAYLRELLEGSAAELRELAARDPLTEVGNYRLLHERLDYELIRHQRNNGELAVLLIDLDRFKQVNERRGHAAGDDVLRRVAATLREAVRQQDTVARQGGDEFAVLAPGTDAAGAAMLAARIRDRLSRIQFAGDTVGATVGWAVYPESGHTGAELLARADEDLMERKLHPRRDAVRSQPETILA